MMDSQLSLHVPLESQNPLQACVKCMELTTRQPFIRLPSANSLLLQAIHSPCYPFSLHASSLCVVQAPYTALEATSSPTYAHACSCMTYPWHPQLPLDHSSLLLNRPL